MQWMTLRLVRLAPALLALLGIVASAAAADDELERYLSQMRERVTDPARPMAQRESLALELAATLDRDAQRAEDVTRRRERWREAAEYLEDFNGRNEDHPRAGSSPSRPPSIAGPGRGPGGNSALLDPTDTEASRLAREALDDAIRRVRSLTEGTIDAASTLAQNVRYRLAQMLADRARLEPEDSDGHRKWAQAALDALGGPITEPGLSGRADLLRADLLARLGRFDEATTALEKVEKATPPPSPAERIETTVAIGIGKGQFDETLAAVEDAALDEAVRQRLAARVLLAKRVALPPGPARDAAEAEAFRLVETLRRGGGPEARHALLDLARSVDEPGRERGPEAWDALAEGRMLRGDVEGAASLLTFGGAKAEARGQIEQAWTLRYRAAAVLFRAGRYRQADELLNRIVNDRRAGSIRPEAGLLRALARGRALASGTPGITAEDYVEALEDQIRAFPEADVTHEARWLLGRVRLETGDREAASALWNAIPPGTPRWLDARLAVGRSQREAIEAPRTLAERDEARRRLDTARSYLDQALAEARTPAQQAEIELARARLELTPEIGDLNAARQILKRWRARPLAEEPRKRLNLLHVAVLLREGQYAEAMTEARQVIATARPDALLEQARLLDRLAGASRSDLLARRCGDILRITLDRLQRDAATLSPRERVETQLRLVRAQFYRGDAAAARRALDREAIPPESLNIELLLLLADTQLQLDAVDAAAATYRVLANRSRAGTLPWFEARYGLALTFERTGQPRPAQQIIDATALLHPDLGGGELRARFERLRQRLERE